MGKVLKIVAVIAIAAAVAYFAPGIGLAALHAVGVSAVSGSAAALAAGAVAASVLSIAATAALQAISGAPADAPSGMRRPVIQRDLTGLRMIEVPPPAPVLQTLAPIEPRSVRWAFFWPWQSFGIVRLAGDCMAGVLPADARWALISRHDAIRPGDLFAFDLDDLWRTYQPEMPWRGWWRIAALGMIKRYLGTDPEWGRLVFDCTNPPTTCETGFNHVRYAYRVRSWHRGWWSAFQARWRVAHQPSAEQGL